MADSISLTIHNSYAPVVDKRTTAESVAAVTLDPAKRYFLSVLPLADYSLGGAPIAPGQTDVTVTVHAHPIPTAQISVVCFIDQNPMNNAIDEHEEGLGGCKVIVTDALNGGMVSTDTFGNPLGTRYKRLANGEFELDPDGNPVVQRMGDGSIHTLTKEEFDAGANPMGLGGNPDALPVGEALIKNLAPGKYGIIVSPPDLDDNGTSMTFIQTNTIEGTPTIDAWVKANEPKLFVEGFGTGFKHVAFGYAKVGPVAPSPYKGQTFIMPPWNTDTVTTATGSITGDLRANHFAKPPNTQGFFAGEPIVDGWVALNDPSIMPGALLEGGGPLQYACRIDGHVQVNLDPPRLDARQIAQPLPSNSALKDLPVPVFPRFPFSPRTPPLQIPAPEAKAATSAPVSARL